jgi:hypothetical protein
MTRDFDFPPRIVEPPSGFGLMIDRVPRVRSRCSRPWASGCNRVAVGFSFVCANGENLEFDLQRKQHPRRFQFLALLSRIFFPALFQIGMDFSVPSAAFR